MPDVVRMMVQAEFNEGKAAVTTKRTRRSDLRGGGLSGPVFFLACVRRALPELDRHTPPGLPAASPWRARAISISARLTYRVRGSHSSAARCHYRHA